MEEMITKTKARKACGKAFLMGAIVGGFSGGALIGVMINWLLAMVIYILFALTAYVLLERKEKKDKKKELGVDEKEIRSNNKQPGIHGK